MEPRIPLDATFTTHSRVQARSRVISVPDVHGDYEGLVIILRKAGLISERGPTNWTGGDAILVQTGDVMDRGERWDDCLRLLAKLHHQAPAFGGKVIVLMGNHELLNVMRDYTYTPEHDQQEHDTKLRREFLPFLRSLPMACIVESILFVHAGLLPGFIEDGGIEGLNAEFKWHVENGQYDYPLLLADHGPLWTRDFALNWNEAQVCSNVTRTLELTGTSKMVVGHTVHPDVRTRCGGRLVLSDVGFCPFYRGHRLALEHHPDGTHTVIEDKREFKYAIIL
jgi:hypothetical protein